MGTATPQDGATAAPGDLGDHGDLGVLAHGLDPAAVGALSGLLERSGADRAMLLAAARLAERAHRGQRRASGEVYFAHPLAVACLCEQLGGSLDMVAAALLHDVVEDTDIDLAAVADATNATVAHLVEGLTKLDGVKYGSRLEARAAEMRRMLVAIADDLRVVVIKLCDRLHNMRTISALPAAKQERIARETLEIFAPLAHRLALHPMKAELEDRCFAVLYPDLYASLSASVASVLQGRSASVDAERIRITEALDQAGISHEITSRIKHLWSIHKKLESSGAALEDIYDILGIRVVVDDVRDCYFALGVIHGLLPPVPGRFKDYIAAPRFNVYRSLHLTCLAEGGVPIEIQIRTREMHEEATRGAASHWAYKAHGDPTKPAGELAWLNRLRQTIAEGNDAHETQDQALDFMSDVRLNLALDELYVFTPQGDVVMLPGGASAIDFAYAIHSDIGDRGHAAKINGKLCSITTKLHTADRCEIITRPGATPSRHWLDHAVSKAARSRVRRHLRQQQVSVGPAAERTKPSRPLRRRLGKAKGQEARITLAEHADVTVTAARCCSPQPGEELFGWLGSSRVVAHKRSCPNVAELRRKVASGAGQELAVVWQHATVEIDLRIAVSDRVGLLSDIAGVLTRSGANIMTNSSSVQRGVAQQRYRALVAENDVALLRQQLDAVSDLAYQLEVR